MTFLLSLQNFKVGTLSDEVLGSILKSMQKICKTCYKNYDTALDILKVLYGKSFFLFSLLILLYIKAAGRVFFLLLTKNTSIEVS